MFLGYQRISEIKALKGSTFSLDEGGFTKSVKRIRRELRVSRNAAGRWSE